MVILSFFLIITERGRRRTRKGDIFTSIRRRFSKGRSHSVMGGDKSPVNGGSSPTPGAEGSDTFLQRSISADRSSMASAGMKMGLGSARSSTSELSGISGFSTTTFVHENSTLVIECVENRVKKWVARYLRGVSQGFLKHFLYT